MREKIIKTMFEITKRPYQKLFKKNKPWDLDKSDLLCYPPDSLGYHLGNFLDSNSLKLEKTLEDHDVIHVLTNIGITVIDEIRLQYYLLGNGKRSLYLYMGILAGLFFFPTHFKEFRKEYKRGKKAHMHYQLNYLKLLRVPTITLRQAFNIN